MAVDSRLVDQEIGIGDGDIVERAGLQRAVGRKAGGLMYESAQ